MASTKLPARLLDTSAVPALNITGDLTVDTTSLYVDSSANRVGIGETTPLGKLHVKTGDSGATADTSADEFVVEGSANAGISILSGASNNGSIYFGDSAVNYDGYIAYSQANRQMTVASAGGGNYIKLDETGHVGFSSTPTAWSSGYKSIQIGDRGFVAAHTGSDLYVGQNAYIDSGWKYEASAGASLTQHSGGQITHYVTPAGTAGNAISWNTGIHIKTTGEVGIGTTSPKRTLQVGDNSQAIAAISLQSTTSGLSRIYMGDNDSTAAEYQGMISYVHSDDDMQFWANGTQYLRLASNGRLVLENKSGVAGNPNLQITNTASSQFNHSVEISCANLGNGQNNGLFIGKAMNSKNTGYLGYRWYSNASNDNYIHLSHWASDYLFYVKGNGDYYHSGSAVSDRDLKENITEVPGTSLDKIINLPIKSFRMKKIDDYTTEIRHQKTGFIAQEVQEVLPDVVTGTDGEKDMGIDPTGIIAHLVRGMKELEARVKELEG